MNYDEEKRLKGVLSKGWIAAVIGAVLAIPFLFPLTLICSTIAFGLGAGVAVRPGFGWRGLKLVLGSLIGPVILLVVAGVAGYHAGR